MVDFKNLAPKELVEEISQKVKSKEAKSEDVINLLKEAREEMPEEFMEEVESTLHVLAEEMQELREALKHKDSETAGTGSGGLGIFGRLNAFAKFVQILKDGGPYSIIALLVISNVWTAMELRDANNRIIDLLITLKVSGTIESSVTPGIPTPSPRMEPAVPTIPPEPTRYHLPPELPANVRERVIRTQQMYEDQVQQYQAQTHIQEGL